MILDSFETKNASSLVLKEKFYNFLFLFEDETQLEFSFPEDEDTWIEKNEKGEVVDFSFYFSIGNQYIYISGVTNNLDIQCIGNGFLIHCN